MTINRKTSIDIAYEIFNSGDIHHVGETTSSSTDINCKACFWIYYEDNSKTVLYHVSSVKKATLIKRKLIHLIVKKKLFSLLNDLT